MDDGGDDVTELAAVKAAEVGLPAAPALSLDRLGFRMWEKGTGGATNFVVRAPAPSPLLF